MMFEYAVLRLSSHTCAMRSARLTTVPAFLARYTRNANSLAVSEISRVPRCTVCRRKSITRSPTVNWALALSPCRRVRARTRKQFTEIERFGEIVVRPFVESRDALLDAIERRQHENRRPVLARADGAAHFESTHAGHQDIENDGIERGVVDRERHRLFAVARLLDVIGRLTKPAHECGSQLPVIFCDEDACHGRNTWTCSVRRCTAAAEKGVARTDHDSRVEKEVHELRGSPLWPGVLVVIALSQSETSITTRMLAPAV